MQDATAAPESQPDRICERNELERALARAIERLPHRDRKVLFLSYDHEMSLDRIGGLFGVSGSRIAQIRRKAVQKMWTELRSGGFGMPGRPVTVLARLATQGGKV